MFHLRIARAILALLSVALFFTFVPRAQSQSPEPTPEQADELCILLGHLVDSTSGLLVPGEPDYHIYKQCQVYQRNLFDKCSERGWLCRNVNIICRGASVGHAVNTVQLSDGTWQLVDTTGGNYRLVGAPFPDPNQIPQDVICAAIGEPAGCSCLVRANSDQALPMGVDPGTCVADVTNSINATIGGSAAFNNVETYGLCANCCQERVKYHWSVNTPERAPFTEHWSNACLNACSDKWPLSATDRWADRNGLLLFRSPAAQPGQDSGFNYFQTICRTSTTNWSLYSQKDQCRRCCLDGALQQKYNPTLSSSCLNACDNFF